MDKFFAETVKGKKAPRPEDEGGVDQGQDDGASKTLPKGVVLGKDGKPCRSCTSSAAWASLMKKSISSSSSSPSSSSSSPSSTVSLPPSQDQCPPDVEQLGRSTWTLLHTMSASYPTTASSTQQSEMKQFLSLFARLYPCWSCAEDFQVWMQKRGNEPRVRGRSEFGRWMCEAHNEVNEKLGKKTFDCGRWEERWRTGAEGC